MIEKARASLLADYRRTGGWAGITHGTMLLLVPLIEFVFGRSVDLERGIVWLLSSSARTDFSIGHGIPRMISSRDFLTLAENWSRGRTEAEWRCAVSRRPSIHFWWRTSLRE